MPESSLPFSPHPLPLPTSLKGGDESFLQVRTRGMARVGVGVGGQGCSEGRESLGATPWHLPIPLSLAAGSVPL